MRKFNLLFCFALLCGSLMAQNLELFGLQTSIYPKQTVTGGAEDGEIGYKEFIGHFTIPQIFNNYQTIVTHTLQYGHLLTETEIMLDGVRHTNEANYHTIVYRLNLNQKLDDKWRLNIGIAPSLASDFEDNLSREDLLLQANAMLIRLKSKTFTYGFGLAVSTRFGRKLIIPIASLSFKSPKRNISIVLPNKVSIMYNTTNKNVYYGFAAVLNGALFNVHNSNEEVNNIVDEAGYSRLNVGPAVEFRLKGELYLKASGGFSTARKLEFISENEDILDRTPDNGPFFNIGISYFPQRKIKTPSEKE